MGRGDTTRSRYYRDSVMGTQTKKSIPVILLIVIFALGVIGVYITTSTSAGDSLVKYGIGNPYNCADCKEFGFACKEHRDVDIKELIAEKTRTYTYNFMVHGTTEQSKQWMYNEKVFNANCDFCTDLADECYSCKYDRETIDSKLNIISIDEVFKSKLCNTCWVLNYANCSNCRAMLINELDSQ